MKGLGEGKSPRADLPDAARRGASRRRRVAVDGAAPPGDAAAITAAGARE